ncbi:MAG: hypothetical protein WD010_00540, partial [Nitriliruptor sp.]
MVRDKRFGWRLLAATGAFAMVATACSSDGGSTDDGATDDDGQATGLPEDEDWAARRFSPPGGVGCVRPPLQVDAPVRIAG